MSLERNSWMVNVFCRSFVTLQAKKQIFIAVRSEGRKKVLNALGDCIVIDRLFESVDGVMEF